MKEYLAKLSFWNILGGAVLVTALAFGFNLVTFTSSAEKMATDQAKAAVTTALTPVCVANAHADPSYAERIEELRGSSSYQRSGKIEEYGWATVPGSDNPNRDVAKACTIIVLAA